ncbi:MAG TPA: family 78 glycoside hydrolase catalytic domain, partial [Opitutaceae bacterium]|nr:family 78 glycoside hydrolase catalytic domain [Opitutaceae bacterium]
MNPVTPLRITCLATFLTLSLACAAAAAAPPEETPRATWKSEWIAHPTAPLREAAVFHFRKVIPLPAAPASFVVHVSADNRFILYVNGQRAGEGPSRGDLGHWRYETLDIAPFLHAGENVVAAVVWNWGIIGPLAQVSDRTAFLMEGNSAAETAVNTDASWEVEQDDGFSFVRREANGFWFYWAADPPQRLDGSSHDWNWKMAGHPAGSSWVAAADSVHELIYARSGVAKSRADGFSFTRWALVPDTLPPMEYTPADAGKVVRSDLAGVEAFPAAAVTIPAHSSVKLLLDRGTMTTGYPEITVSGGKGSSVVMAYTEALYDSKQRRGNRAEVGDRVVLGQSDTFLPDGGDDRTFGPLWFRTWRFLEVRVITSDSPVILESLHVHFSAYPFQEKASFSSDDPVLGRLWDICWRGARLGAHDTYMDTPYWEQLQYLFDTRIQAMISYTVADDDRLARQALRAFDQSRLPEGVTQSRYPDSLTQVIPSFSIEYIGMLHDYWMYRQDLGILRELLPGSRAVIGWFTQQLGPDDYLKPLKFGNGLDSPMGGDFKGFPYTDSRGRSALTTLRYVGALRDAADLEDALGDAALASRYRQQAGRSAKAVYRDCWNARLGMLADTPDQNSYSQHTNLAGVLTDAIPVVDQAGVMQHVIDAEAHPAPGGPRIALVSYPYQFLLIRAVDKAGLGGQYLDLLASWRQMVALGFTTVAESPDPGRSDTHAWTAHPLYDLLTVVAGIHPSAPGFASVRISP